MKKILLLSGLLIFTISILNAQSPRMVFVEEITQASCPPCAPFNAALQPILNANSDKVVFLGYQVWWPGYDPMYLDNPTDVNARVGYYNGNSAPSIIRQGSNGPGNAQLTQSFINSTYAETSEFDMTVSAEVVDGMLNITGIIDATSDVSGNLKLRLVLTEKTIHITDAPGGTNGETEYHHVMKKFVGGTSGITLASSWTAGDSYTINESFNTFDLKIYDYNELEVIAFIQNDNGKFVHQAAKDDQVDLISTTVNNGLVDEIELPVEFCAGSQEVDPKVRVLNAGSSDLTSFDLVYSISGGNEQTYQWSGNLVPYDSQVITLSPYTFVITEDSEVVIQLQNPNGNTDEDMSNNNVEGVIELAPAGDNGLNLKIKFDPYPTEVSWQIRKGDGTLIELGNNYSSGLANQTIELFIAAPDEDCYYLRMIDSYGDGMASGNEGYFELKNADGTLLAYAGGSDVWSVRNEYFNVNVISGIEDIAQLASFDVYPNPVSDNLNIDFDIDTESMVSFELYNILGALVYSQPAKSFIGSNVVNIDVSNFNAGMYTLNMVVDGNYATSKISILK